jgi:hypothetical protein
MLRVGGRARVKRERCDVNGHACPLYRATLPVCEIDPAINYCRVGPIAVNPLCETVFCWMDEADLEEVNHANS